MLYTLSSGLWLLVFLCATTVSSTSLSALPQCWQTCVTAPSLEGQCSENDLNCICQSFRINLDSVLACVRRTCGSSLHIDDPFRALQSTCGSTPHTLPYTETLTALNAAREEMTEKDLKARSTPEEKVEELALAIRAAAAQATSFPMTTAPPTKFPTTISTSIIPNSILIDNGVASGSPIPIPAYTDTPPLLFSDPTTSSSAHKATGSSSSSDGGTLLDMSNAASRGGIRRGSLLGLTVGLLACVALF